MVGSVKIKISNERHHLTCYYPVTITTLNPLPDDKILDRSKLKQFADNNFEFDENGRKLSKWVESTVGRGEIARHEQFLLFPQCFQKACFPGASKGVIKWERVKGKATENYPRNYVGFLHFLPFLHRFQR